MREFVPASFTNMTILAECRAGATIWDSKVDALRLCVAEWRDVTFVHNGVTYKVCFNDLVDNAVKEVKESDNTLNKDTNSAPEGKKEE